MILFTDEECYLVHLSNSAERLGIPPGLIHTPDLIEQGLHDCIQIMSATYTSYRFITADEWCTGLAESFNNKMRSNCTHIIMSNTGNREFI